MQNVIVGVVGMKGYGKSTYLRRALERVSSVLLVDTLAEHQSWCPPCPGADIPAQICAIAAPPESFHWSVLVHPGIAEMHFNFVARAAFVAGDMTFAVEEVDYFSHPHGDCEGLELLIRYGRHRRIDLLWVCRNLAEVSRKLTSQTDVFVLFHTQEPRYVDALAERLTPEIASEVESLPPFHYVEVRKSGEIGRSFVA